MIKCDICGQFISYEDLENGKAVNEMVTPDSEFTTETFEALCPAHNSHPGPSILHGSDRERPI